MCSHVPVVALLLSQFPSFQSDNSINFVVMYNMYLFIYFCIAKGRVKKRLVENSTKGEGVSESQISTKKKKKGLNTEFCIIITLRHTYFFSLQFSVG